MPEDHRIKYAHGGRRPGAGAKKGNVNALKTGRYSNRVQALKAVLRDMPHHQQLLQGIDGRDTRQVQLLGYALTFYGEILLHIASGGSIDDLTDAQIRDRVIASLPEKQTQRIVEAIDRSLGGGLFRA